MRPLALAMIVGLGLTAQSAGAQSCAARPDTVGGAFLHWIEGPQEDRHVLDEWCRGVGPPLYVSQPRAGGAVPNLRDLVIVAWNAHLHEGRLTDLIDALRRGEITGSPVHHFVLLVQELYRRGPEVPRFAAGARSARAVHGDEDAVPDANEYASTLGLSMLYVPSMRNGAELFEDRGNAVVSTESLSGAISLELPFERQRRIAVGASVQVMRDGIISTLRVMNVHFEPLSTPRSLWFFRNPRKRQAAAVLDMLSASRFEDDVAWAGTVLGGDFNTVKLGIDEGAYRAARNWGYSTREEDRRATHRLGRIDYLFYRLREGWSGTTLRVEEKFGSDHHPVLGRFTS